MGTISPERVESNKLLRRWCADVTGRVLSIGSGGDIDKQGRHYRDYFAKASAYITSDVVPGCDLSIDVRQIDMPEASVECVFVSGVLEHVDDCHAAASEMHRVLTPGGLLIVGVPFKQPIHRAPQDYWRFSEYGLRWLLRSFDVRDVVPIGDPVFPIGYWARAIK